MIISRLVPDAASSILTALLKQSLYLSFPYQATHNRNRPQKRYITEIFEYAPHNQNEKHPYPFPLTTTSPHSTPPFASCTPERLHACTPNACTGTPVGATNTRSGTRYKKTYPSKKRSGTGNGGPTNQRGGASEPHRRIDREGAWHSATIRCHAIYRVWCLCFWCLWCFCVCLCCSSMRGGCSWKSIL